MMIVEEIKANINKIDFELKEVFENVIISEKSDRVGHYFEILASSKFLFEDSSWKNAAVCLKIYKQDLVTENVRWFYQVDTLNEKSDWIERSSNLDFFAVDVNNVILLKQMSEDYFSKLEPIVEVINESSINVEDKTIEEKITDILNNYNILVNSITYSNEAPMFENNTFPTNAPDKKIYFIHNQEIKMSDKFMIESAINLISGVNYVRFSDNDIMVDYSPK